MKKLNNFKIIMTANINELELSDDMVDEAIHTGYAEDENDEKGLMEYFTDVHFREYEKDLKIKIRRL